MYYFLLSMYMAWYESDKANQLATQEQSVSPSVSKGKTKKSIKVH